MKEQPDVVSGDKLPAENLNNLNHELENLIADSGQIPDINDETQFSKAVDFFGSPADIYCTDSGSNGKFILAPVLENPQEYFPGMKLIFKVASVPDVNSTINLNNLGEKKVQLFSIAKTATGQQSNQIGNLIIAYYDNDNDIFLLRNDLCNIAPSYTRDLNISGSLETTNSTLKLKLSVVKNDPNYATSILVQPGLYHGQFITGSTIEGSGNFNFNGPNDIVPLEIYIGNTKIRTTDLKCLSFQGYNQLFTGSKIISPGNRIWTILISTNRDFNRSVSSKDFVGYLVYYMDY